MNEPYDNSGSDERDQAIAAALSALDPAGSDPAYWFRFHRTVMSAAREELARRRMVAGVTVDEVLLSWGRTLVPATMLAAALAGFLLLQGARATGPADPLLGVEEMLADGLQGTPIPTVVSSPEYPDAEGAVLFASETY